MNTARITLGTQNATEDASLLLKDKSEFMAKLIEMNSLNSFWMQVNEPEYEQTLKEIQKTLNTPGSYQFKIINRMAMYPGLLVVSMFVTEDSADFYRAKILRIESDFVEV